MDEPEINALLSTFGFKENAYGGMEGVLHGVKFTICIHMFNGLCFMGHFYDVNSLSQFEEYIPHKLITKERIAYKIYDICERCRAK